MPKTDENKKTAGSNSRLMESEKICYRVGGVTLVPPGSEFGPMIRPCCQLTWMIEGTGSVDMDGTKYFIQPGDIFFEQKGIRVHYQWNNESIILGFIQFELEQRGMLPPLESWPRIASSKSETNLLHVLPQYILDIDASASTERDLLLHNALVLLLSSFAYGQTQPSAEMHSILPHAVSTTLEYMHTLVEQSETNLGAVTVDDLARHVHVASGTLSRLFRKHLDSTPMRCLRALRLDRAASLLTGSEMRVKGIALAVGFQSEFNFSRKFREEYGMPPTEYRKRTRHGEYIGGSSIRVLTGNALLRAHNRTRAKLSNDL